MEATDFISIVIPAEKVFHLKEHDIFEHDILPYIISLNLDFKETDYEGVPKYLGITPDFRASYYIGADWLTTEKAVVVTPKIENVDFVEMFMKALKFAPSARYFTKFYGIDFSKSKIESPEMDNILTPLLMIDFLFSVKRLLDKGLKKGYVNREENLKNKIKGKVILSKQYSKNIVNQCKDRIMCSYQEFSYDIPENRLIKKALMFIKRSFSIMPAFREHRNYAEIKSLLSSSISAFEGISEEIDINAVRAVQKNKLYGAYNETLSIAKKILKKYDYSINLISEDKHTVPPFWIDMSRLYEVYVYSLLVTAFPKQIKFQVKGHYGTAVDFLKLDEQIIMDTKYKPRYATSNSGVIDDIREISGYARDEMILRELNLQNSDGTVPVCLIIYPEPEDENKSILFDGSIGIIPASTKISGFKNFYKICVPVPRFL